MFGKREPHQTLAAHKIHFCNTSKFPSVNASSVNKTALYILFMYVYLTCTSMCKCGSVLLIERLSTTHHTLIFCTRWVLFYLKIFVVAIFLLLSAPFLTFQLVWCGQTSKNVCLFVQLLIASSLNKYVFVQSIFKRPTVINASTIACSTVRFA